ncbi:MAG: glycosyltransferase family 2 protein [Akkermansia sp.]
MNHAPLVSVVTVCYNLIKNGREAFFRQCADSVHRQNYPHIEHIVIDGGSHDGTVELLESYAQKGWLKYISEPDQGIYDAMNKGIRAAQGKYVAFLNSDDYWHNPDGVAASVDALESHGAAFSYAPHNRVSQTGEILVTANPSIGVFAELMPFSHQTMFTRRDVLLAHHGFDEKKYRLAADYDLILRILISGAKCIFVPCNFTSFRLDGISTVNAQKSADEVYLIQQAHFGEEGAKMLCRGCMDDCLMQYIVGRVHGHVAVDMLRSHRLDSPGVYRLAYGIALSTARGGLSEGYSARKAFYVKLFALIPIMTVKQRKSRTDYCLFGFFPIVRFRKKGNIMHIRIFCVIPVLSVRTKII